MHSTPHLNVVLQLAAEQGADLLLTVKKNQRTLHSQIADQFRYRRHFPLQESHLEQSHSHRVLWKLRARNATDALRER